MSTTQDFNKMSYRKMKKSYFNIGYQGTPADMTDLMTKDTSYFNDHFFLGGIEKAFNEGRTDNLKALLTGALIKSDVTGTHMDSDLHGRQGLMVFEFLEGRTAQQLQKLLAVVPEKDRQALLQNQLGDVRTVKDTQALLDAGADIHANNEQALVDTVSRIETSRWLAKDGLGEYGTILENHAMKRVSRKNLKQEEAKLKFLYEKGADFDKAIAAEKSAYYVDELKQAQHQLQSPPPEKNLSPQNFCTCCGTKNI